MTLTKKTTLRFIEFNDCLIESKIDDFTEWSSGGTPSKDCASFWGGDIPWITASSMRGIRYNDSELKITSEGLKNGSRLAPKGSLLLLVRGSMLFNTIPIGIAQRDLAFNQDVKAILVNSSHSSEYVFQWFKSSENKLLNMVVGTGIGAGKLDTQGLKNLVINLPSLPEQTKIATFLSAIDEKIERQQRLLTLWQAYKKGIMQQIFTQQLRFKFENDTSKWSFQRMGDICTFFSGGTPLTSKKEYYIGDIPFIKSGEINAIQTEQYISNDALEDSSSKMVNKGDLLYALYGATSGESGISKINGAINQAVLCIRSKNNINYINQYLTFSKQSILSKYLQGGQGNLSAQIIKDLVIPLPSHEEQTKIATFLSSLDGKIAHIQRQLTSFREFKKGLLQQMFV